MPKITKALTAIEVNRLSAPKMHAVGTVPGLMLDIKNSGAKAWILRTTVGTRRSDIGLGGFPGVKLAAAIEAARQIKTKIKEGIDPTAERRAKQAIVEWTFKRCSEAYIKGHRAEWKSIKHGDQWENTLTTYVYPHFGHKHVRDIDVSDVINAIEPNWTTKNETMVRVRNRIELVLSWATARGYRPKDKGNPATWRGNLDHVLAKPSKVNNRKHHPAVQIDEAYAFLKHLRTIQGTAARCLEFVAMTACRSGEIRMSTWSEFDLKAAVWSVPAERMKADRPHRVPLAAQVLSLLEKLHRFEGTELLFPGRDGKKPLSDMALNQIMRRMPFKDKDGRQCVPHGLRSTFSDWGADRTAWHEKDIEMALAHAIGDETVGAYRRGDLFDKRRHLMSDWANFLESIPAVGDNVIPPSQGR